MRILLYSAAITIIIGILMFFITRQEMFSLTMSIQSLIEELMRFAPSSIITLGILILVVTPVINIFIVSANFINDNERLFAIITIVLILFISISIAISLL